jgi:hypothetical protein
MAIARAFTLYRPLQVWGTLGLACALVGAVPFVRFLYFFEQGNGGGHIQSLIVGSVLLFLGVQMYITGLLASAIAWNRALLEDVLYRWKDEEGRRRVEADGYANGKNGGHARRDVHVA